MATKLCTHGWHPLDCPDCPDPRDAEIARLRGEVAELRGFLAEIAELVGPGGDNSPFGRVESALVGLTGRLDDARADLAAHKRALAAGPAALRDKACPRNDCGDCEAWRRASDVVEAAQEAAMKERVP